LLPSSGNVVVNNTVVNGIPGQPAAGRWCLNIQDGSVSNIIFNNILLNYHGFRGSIDLCPSCTPGTVSDFNIVMDRFTLDGGSGISLAQWRAATGLDAHSRAVPSAQWALLFANLGTNDYRLGPTSIAADFGVAALAGVSAPLVDRAGTPRPSGAGFDAGGYERACRADVTRDGGVDGDDVVLFFAWFDSADTRANFDGSQGVDGDDVIIFFGSWDAGC
ncbi:MAG: GC-type dockerin domain-anchored protein, partial [Phycisphaerales bacterium]